jgi:hypothetical protein
VFLKARQQLRNPNRNNVSKFVFNVCTLVHLLAWMHLFSALPQLKWQTTAIVAFWVLTKLAPVTRKVYVNGSSNCHSVKKNNLLHTLSPNFTNLFLSGVRKCCLNIKNLPNGQRHLNILFYGPHSWPHLCTFLLLTSKPMFQFKSKFGIRVYDKLPREN